MQPSAAVVALVDDDGIAVAVVVVEQVVVNLSEALAVHGFHMNVSQASARETVDDMAVAVYPTLVEQFFQGTLADGTDGDVLAVDGKADGLPDLAVEQVVIVHAALNGDTVDFLDDAACGNLFGGQRAALDGLLDAETVAIIGGVEEDTQMGRGLRGTIRIVAGASM